MTRQEHLEWSKKRAREYLEAGDIQNAITSMLSDLGKHPETAPAGEKMAMLGMMYCVSGGPDDARRFIEGFN